MPSAGKRFLIQRMRDFGIANPIYRLVQKIYDETGLISKMMAYESPRQPGQPAFVCGLLPPL